MKVKAINNEIKGLAKPLITKILEIANELDHKGIILHTQTTTWLAAKLYLDYTMCMFIIKIVLMNMNILIMKIKLF